MSDVDTERQIIRLLLVSRRLDGVDQTGRLGRIAEARLKAGDSCTPHNRYYLVASMVLLNVVVAVLLDEFTQAVTQDKMQAREI